jgi:signal transduction histidine kinase
VKWAHSFAGADLLSLTGWMKGFQAFTMARSTRTILTELRPASLDGGGLASALLEICAAYQDRLGFTVDASVHDVTVPAVEHALLRVTQEACANAVRYSGARQLSVSLTRRDGQVELAVGDAGSGFDPAAAPTSPSGCRRRDDPGGDRRRPPRRQGRALLPAQPGAGD